MKIINHFLNKASYNKGYYAGAIEILTWIRMFFKFQGAAYLNMDYCLFYYLKINQRSNKLRNIIDDFIRRNEESIERYKKEYYE